MINLARITILQLDLITGLVYIHYTDYYSYIYYGGYQCFDEPDAHNRVVLCYDHQHGFGAATLY